MDYGHKLTEKELEELEKRISKEYETAEKEVREKLFKYLQDFKRKDATKKAQMEAGLISQTEYNNWRVNQMIVGKRWETLRNNLAEDFHNTNNIAKEMIKEHSYDIYALNHNYGTYEIEKGLGIDTSYTLYDRATVERLVRDNPQMLPPPGKKVSERIKEGLDVRWNNQQIQSVMMQGLLQGMSMPDLAKRLAETVGDKDKVGAMRNARTMTTGAQNAGRVDSYKRAKDMGIKTKQRWIATLDERTRESHRHLDGEMVEVGEKFSNGLRFPGDPSGAPEEVYNCRCTLIAAIEGTSLAGDIETVGRTAAIDMDYEEWKKGKEPAEKVKEPKKEEPKKEEETSQVVQGTDLTTTWERRKDEFEFQIEDIINAQGFDGLPRVVSADEFDKYVQESNFVAQRTYSATDEETLQAYQDSLYNGKWYVDCSVGGCAHGKGMYCAASYDGELNENIFQEMRDYIGQNDVYTKENAPHIIETFTIDKSANFLEIPKGVDDYEYVADLFSDYLLRKLGEGKGVEDKVEEVISLREQKRANSQSFFHNEITEEEYGDTALSLNDKLWELNHTDEISSLYDEYFKLSAYQVHDIGELAALMGYDGLHTHYGTCGNDTIIVNRTKLIFKGE